MPYYNIQLFTQIKL